MSAAEIILVLIQFIKVVRDRFENNYFWKF